MSWVKLELETINLGDQRLNRRVVNVLERLGLSPGRTIPQTFQSRSETKACYNLFDNDLVTEEKLLEPHIEKTIERIQECPVVLLLSDTTEIDYTSKEVMVGKTRLSNKKKGLWLHPTLAITPEKLPLGIVDANFWERKDEPLEDSSTARTAQDNAPIEEKESFRWLKSYRCACEIAQRTPNTQIVNITDREGDIIEILAEAQEQQEKGQHAHFIIRSQYDRMLVENDSEDGTIHKKLWKKLRESASLGEIEFTIPATEQKKGRKVKQEVKAVSVDLKPITKNGKQLKVRVNAVMLIEKKPPEGQAPLVWILLTTLPINTFEDTLKITEYYLCRWQIELFFKVLKSGCKIEERQLQTADRMKNLIALFIVLSWRVMYAMMLGRLCPEMPCSDVFEEAEWKSVYKIAYRKKRLPRKAPILSDFIVMVAILGGYVVQKGGEPPGVKVMWKGMARMIDFAIAWDAFGG